MSRDHEDFKAHPEWFYLDPLREFMRPNAMMKLIDPQAYEDAMAAWVNPPVVLRRKPVPFVLPIRGAAR